MFLSCIFNKSLFFLYVSDTFLIKSSSRIFNIFPPLIYLLGTFSSFTVHIFLFIKVIKLFNWTLSLFLEGLILSLINFLFRIFIILNFLCNLFTHDFLFMKSLINRFIWSFALHNNFWNFIDFWFRLAFRVLELIINHFRRHL